MGCESFEVYCINQSSIETSFAEKYIDGDGVWALLILGGYCSLE